MFDNSNLSVLEEQIFSQIKSYKESQNELKNYIESQISSDELIELYLINDDWLNQWKKYSCYEQIKNNSQLNLEINKLNEIRKKFNADQHLLFNINNLSIFQMDSNNEYNMEKINQNSNFHIINKECLKKLSQNRGIDKEIKIECQIYNGKIIAKYYEQIIILYKHINKLNLILLIFNNSNAEIVYESLKGMETYELLFNLGINGENEKQIISGGNIIFLNKSYSKLKLEEEKIKKAISSLINLENNFYPKLISGGMNNLNINLYLINEDWLQNFKKALNYIELNQNHDLNINTMFSAYKENPFSLNNEIINEENNIINYLKENKTEYFIKLYSNYALITEELWNILSQLFKWNIEIKVNTYIIKNNVIIIYNKKDFEIFELLNNKEKANNIFFHFNEIGKIEQVINEMKNIGVSEFYKKYKINLSKNSPSNFKLIENNISIGFAIDINKAKTNFQEYSLLIKEQVQETEMNMGYNIINDNNNDNIIMSMMVQNNNNQNIINNQNNNYNEQNFNFQNNINQIENISNNLNNMNLNDVNNTKNILNELSYTEKMVNENIIKNGLQNQNQAIYIEVNKNNNNFCNQNNNMNNINNNNLGNFSNMNMLQTTSNNNNFQQNVNIFNNNNNFNNFNNNNFNNYNMNSCLNPNFHHMNSFGNNNVINQNNNYNRMNSFDQIQNMFMQQNKNFMNNLMIENAFLPRNDILKSIVLCLFNCKIFVQNIINNDINQQNKPIINSLKYIYQNNDYNNGLSKLKENINRIPNQNINLEDPKIVFITIIEYINNEICGLIQNKNLVINQSKNSNNEKFIFQEFMSQIFNPMNNTFITKNFFGIREFYYKCKNCNLVNFNFEILKLIELSVEDINVYLVNKLQNYIKKGKSEEFIKIMNNNYQKVITINDCFDYYTRNELKKNNIACFTCSKIFDNVIGYYKLIKVPNILFITIKNRKNYAVSVELIDVFNITVNAVLIKYELISAIINSNQDEKYYSLIKKENKTWELHLDNNKEIITLSEAQKKGFPFLLVYQLIK